MMEKLSGKVIGYIAGGIFVLLLIGLLIHSWQKSHQAAAVGRLEGAQSGATVNSAKDAIASEGAVAANQQASEDLTRANAEEITHAKGADAPVPAAVAAAGRDSLCKRGAYRGSQYCLQRASPAGVAQGR